MENENPEEKVGQPAAGEDGPESADSDSAPEAKEQDMNNSALGFVILGIVATLSAGLAMLYLTGDDYARGLVVGILLGISGTITGVSCVGKIVKRGDGT